MQLTILDSSQFGWSRSLKHPKTLKLGPVFRPEKLTGLIGLIIGAPRRPPRYLHKFRAAIGELLSRLSGREKEVDDQGILFLCRVPGLVSGSARYNGFARIDRKERSDIRNGNDAAKGDNLGIHRTMARS